MGEVIVVVSGKGGTGKTSFTAGVGSALALLGKRVLVLDGDIGLRNLDMALGLTDRALMDFCDVATGRCALEDAAIPHPRIPGLFLLTAPLNLHGELITDGQMQTLTAQIRGGFDFCLIDAPAGLGSGFRLTTCGADRAVIVTTTDATSLRDAQRAVMLLGDKFSRNRLHLVVNRVRKKMLR
ncbi:MAG: P-loop NTPase, partial [Oscillospiraceae bacterium]